MLDLVFTNEESMISDLLLHEPVGKNDCAVLLCQFQCYNFPLNPCNTFSEIVKYFYAYCNFDVLCSAFHSVDGITLLKEKPVEDTWHIIADQYQAIVDSYVPH